jgi:hypothetical protein
MPVLICLRDRDASVGVSQSYGLGPTAASKLPQAWDIVRVVWWLLVLLLTG